MKKLLLVLSIVTVGAKADWMSDLESGFQDVVNSDQVRSVVNQYVPKDVQNQVSEIVQQVAPVAAPYVQKAAKTVETVVNNIPAEQRNQLIATAKNVVQQTAAVAQAE